MVALEGRAQSEPIHAIRAVARPAQRELSDVEPPRGGQEPENQADTSAVWHMPLARGSARRHHPPMFPRLAEIPTPWGPIPLYTHGALLALALLVAWYLIVHPSLEPTTSERADQPTPEPTEPGETKPTEPAPRVGPLDRAFRGRVVLASALAGIFMGKLARAAATDGVLFEGGVEALGFLLGAGLASWAMLRDRLREAPRALVTVASRFVPAGLLVAGAIAIGEHLGGARFGVRGVAAGLSSLGTYPRWPSASTDPTHALGAPAWRAHVDAGLLEPTAAWSLPTFPAPFFDATIALTLAALAARFPRASGYALALYALGRLALDRFRDPASISDAATAALVVAFGFMLARALRSEPSREPPAGLLEQRE